MADVEVRQTAPRNGGGMGWVLALVGLVVVLLVAWMLFSGNRADEGGSEINIEIPQADAPSINIPDRVDVNVDVNEQ